MGQLRQSKSRMTTTLGMSWPIRDTKTLRSTWVPLWSKYLGILWLKRTCHGVPHLYKCMYYMCSSQSTVWVLHLFPTCTLLVSRRDAQGLDPQVLGTEILCIFGRHDQSPSKWPHSSQLVKLWSCCGRDRSWKQLVLPRLRRQS